MKNSRKRVALIPNNINLPWNAKVVRENCYHKNGELHNEEGVKASSEDWCENRHSCNRALRKGLGKGTITRQKRKTTADFESKDYRRKILVAQISPKTIREEGLPRRRTRNVWVCWGGVFGWGGVWEGRFARRSNEEKKGFRRGGKSSLYEKGRLTEKTPIVKGQTSW